MRLLQVCNKLPFPATDGGAIAMNNITNGLLNEGVDVTVFALVTSKTRSLFQQVPEEYRKKTHLVAPFIDTDIKVLDALLNLFSSKSYNLQRFYSAEVEQQLINVLKATTFDVIQLESIFVSSYIKTIRKYSNAKIVLRAHNIEQQIWKRLSETSSNPLKKWYLRLMSERLKREEQEAFRQVDLIATITEADRKQVMEAGINKPVVTIPFGLDLSYLEPSINQTSDVFHLGSMDWMPNLEGVNWLLDKVMPVLQEMKTDYKLYLAGKNMPAEIFDKASEHIRVEGVIQDAVIYMKEKSIMVVPLFSGGGMRVKIIEGMALGKAIVSTTVGAEGIECEHGKNILIADTPEAFASCIASCINDKELCRNLGENARKLVEQRYDIGVITKQLLGIYRNLVV